MTPVMRARLQAAFDHAGERKREGATAATIINELVRDHRAAFRDGNGTYTLRVAGVQTSCTSSKDEGLLGAWKSRASVALLEPEGGYASE
jgi:hypothetical protein